MANGSFNVATNNSYIVGNVIWSSIPNIDNNTSQVTATFRMSRTNNYTTSGQGNFYLNINGVQKVSSGTFSVSLNSNTILVTNTVTVPHDSNGDKILEISVSGTHARFNIVPTSQSFTLENIARGSKPLLYASEIELGKNITIDIVKASPEFRHILKYQVGGSAVEVITTGVDSQYNWLIPLVLAYNLPNATEGIMTIYCDTYNGSKYISTRSVEILVKIPPNMIPTTDKITTTELNPKVISLGAKNFINQISTIEVKVDNAFVSLPYGAKVKSFRIELGDEFKEGGTVVFDKPKATGLTNIKVTITDTRGRFSSKLYSIFLESYQPPSLSIFQTQRVDNFGVPTQEGERVVFKYAGQTTRINNSAGVNVNTYDITLFYKDREVITFQKLYEYLNNKTTPFNEQKIFVNFSQLIAYDFRIEIKDAFFTSKAFSVISVAKTVLSLGKDGVGVNKIWENGSLDVKGDIFEDGISLRNKYVKKEDTLFTALRYEYRPTQEFVINTPTIKLLGTIDSVINTSMDVNIGGKLNTAGTIESTGLINGKSGYLNVAKKTGMQWEGGIASGSSVVITHNLGYFPICQVYNGNGGAGIAFDIVNINQVKAKYWSATGAGWYGFIMLW